MIVLNLTTKKVFRELIKCLGVIKKNILKGIKKRNKTLKWKEVQDIYFTIDNLVLEMASGMKIDNTKGFDKILKLYQNNALPEKVINYGFKVETPPTKRKLNKSKKKTKKII